MPDGGTKAYEGKGGHPRRALLTGRAVAPGRCGSRTATPAAARGEGYLAPYTMLLYKHGLYVVGLPAARARPTARAIDPDTRIAVYAVERFT